ncbi:restriction endonuclease subunit S [Ureaplasma zalophigenitalium]|uniref:Restriction endonuclease subunit S n=1 Tax=Ureaplasma zalophigenitalium TaxID=907723 RepID=A0ABT3BQ16_9BACT|nr:restriction endonuclease subunit S [Ureaplasma zalophigenitalium]MCV3754358.1 restriction endonuclease subunit S [Ureaplasma zalophigenitalium]
MNNKLVPAIRFKEFTNDWEQRRVGDLLRSSTIKNNGKYDINHFLSVAKTVKSREIPRDIKLKTLDNYNILKYGNIVYEGHTTKEHQFGFLVLNLHKTGIISDIFSIFEFIDQQDLYFWKYLLANNNIFKYILKDSTKSGIMMNSIVKNDFYKKKLNVGISVKESELIGRLFNRIDLSISLLQCKLEKLKNLKNNLLEKMFADEKHPFPKIRFKEFTNAWEQRRVGDLFILTRGTVVSTNKLSKIKTSLFKYPVYSSKTVNEGLLGYYDKYLFENCITWTTDGYAGNVMFRPGKFFSTNVSGVLLGSPKYSNYCTAHSLNNVAYKHVSNSGIPKLMNNVMQNIKIWLPQATDEINNLSHLLEKWSVTISLLQRKLEKMENIKNTLLQKMFV